MNARDELRKLMGIDATGLVLNLHRGIDESTRVERPRVVDVHAIYMWRRANKEGELVEAVTIDSWELWAMGGAEHRIFYDVEHNILFIAQVN